MNSSNTRKEQLRVQLKQRLKSRVASEDAVSTIYSSLGRIFAQRPGAWASYKAIQEEVPTPESWESVRFCFPKVEGDRLHFYQGQNFQTGPFGIQEPDVASSYPVPLESCVGVLVPGLGFDRNGFRLGRGKGYYDKALVNFKGYKVGVCYGMQVVDALPVETQDIPMNCIVTENEVMEISWK